MNAAKKGLGRGLSALFGDIENKSSDTTFYKNNKYKYYFYPDLDFLKIYDHLQVTVRPNDKRYILEYFPGSL